MYANRLCPPFGSAIAMVLFFVLPAASAQSAPSAGGYGVRANTGDAAFHVGWNDMRFDSGKGTTTATVLGGSAGYNATEHIAVIGEYEYARQGSKSGVGSSAKLYGGALRFPLTSGRISPYVVGGGGGIRETAGPFGADTNADGWYLSFGGGASLFVARHWGVRPEFRYYRSMLSVERVTTGANLYQVGGSLFFQFGAGIPHSSRKISSLRSLFADKLKKRNS